MYHLYVIRVNNRDKLRDRLNEVGISTGMHYPLSLHLQPCFNYLNHREGSFPIAERQAGQILSLPIFSHILQEQLDYVVEHVNRFAEPL